MYNETNSDNNYCFIGEFRKNQECADGIPFDDLKRIVSQLDLSSLPNHEKYELSIEGVYSYNKDNLNPNDYQKSIKKFIFSNGILQKHTENYISGKFLLITISGFDNGSGHSIAYIFYKI